MWTIFGGSAFLDRPCKVLLLLDIIAESFAIITEKFYFRKSHFEFSFLTNI